MKRYKAPYTLFNRGKIWYYRLASDPKRVPHSTGQTLKGEADKVAEEEAKEGIQNPVATKLLRKYLPEAFEKYMQMQVADGNPLNEAHCKDSRRYIRYILSDKIVDLELGKVSLRTSGDSA